MKPSKFEQLVVKDILPYQNGIYIAVDLMGDNDGIQAIQDQIREVFDVPLDTFGLHCTLIYSQQSYDNKKDLKINPKKIFNATIKEITTWDDGKTTYFGILLDSKDLEDENKRLMKYGFVSDFDHYMPHVTLQYDTKIDKEKDKEALKKMNAYFKQKNYALCFNNEHSEPLNNNWENEQ